MIYPRFYILLFSISICVSCSAASKDKSGNSGPVVSSDQSVAVEPITVPLIEMKSLSLNTDKGTVVPVKTDLGIPAKNEIQRLPKDFFIGDLGQGIAPISAYTSVNTFLANLVQASQEKDLLRFLPKEEQEKIALLIRTITPNQFRVGGGKVEGENRYSFLFRLIGTSGSASGAIYTYLENNSWVIDDISLEKDDTITFDPLQYKHFF